MIFLWNSRFFGHAPERLRYHGARSPMRIRMDMSAEELTRYGALIYVNLELGHPC
jgi:hypothetical protein